MALRHLHTHKLIHRGKWGVHRRAAGKESPFHLRWLAGISTGAAVTCLKYWLTLAGQKGVSAPGNGQVPLMRSLLGVASHSL